MPLGILRTSQLWLVFVYNKKHRFIDNVKDTMIYSDIYGSDHCPIGIEIEKYTIYRKLKN